MSVIAFSLGRLKHHHLIKICIRYPCLKIMWVKVTSGGISLDCHDVILAKLPHFSGIFRVFREPIIPINFNSFYDHIRHLGHFSNIQLGISPRFVVLIMLVVVLVLAVTTASL